MLIVQIESLTFRILVASSNTGLGCTVTDTSRFVLNNLVWYRNNVTATYHFIPDNSDNYESLHTYPC
jgi:hypothetical protein